MKKKLAMSLNPTLTIKVNGDSIEMTTTAGPKKVTNAFKLGEEFTSDGEIQAMVFMISFHQKIINLGYIIISTLYIAGFRLNRTDFN